MSERLLAIEVRDSTELTDQQIVEIEELDDRYFALTPLDQLIGIEPDEAARDELGDPWAKCPELYAQPERIEAFLQEIRDELGAGPGAESLVHACVETVLANSDEQMTRDALRAWAVPALQEARRRL